MRAEDEGETMMMGFAAPEHQTRVKKKKFTQTKMRGKLTLLSFCVYGAKVD
jgi:hypothetical protein